MKKMLFIITLLLLAVNIVSGIKVCELKRQHHEEIIQVYTEVQELRYKLSLIKKNIEENTEKSLLLKSETVHYNKQQ